jgi:zinc/manganese transport system ATP-binding protein
MPVRGFARQAVLEIDTASLSFGDRRLWTDLSLEVYPGEFLAVLGANGSGKTSLLRAILGLLPLSAGTVRVAGLAARRGSTAVGYIPQQQRLDPLTPMRARDLVAQSLVGHRWGPGWPDARRRRRVTELIDAVGATAFRDRPVGQLSGGEQQRIRVAQALAADPRLLLCDEPLLSLDPTSQHTVTGLIEDQRRAHGAAVLFVTHEINAVLPYVDRVLYLADGRFRIGPAEAVLTSAALSDLYGAPIEVGVGDQIIEASVAVPEHHRQNRGDVP